MNNRRNFLASLGLGAVTTALFVNKEAAAVIPTKPKVPCPNPNRILALNYDWIKEARLLQRCGHYTLSEAIIAGKEVEGKIAPHIIKAVLQQTGVPLILGHAPIKTTPCQDLGTSCDFLLKDARNGRLDILNECVNAIIEVLVHKINEHKKSDSFISHMGVYFDEAMHRQRRIGFYAWVELENPKDNA